MARKQLNSFSAEDASRPRSRGSLFQRNQAKQVTAQYAAVKLALLLLDGSVAFGKAAKKYSGPFIRLGARGVKIIFLNTILSAYFGVLKARKKIRSAFQTSRYRVLSLSNTYIFKATITVIVIFTIINNFATYSLNAEELQSELTAHSLIRSNDELSLSLIEEGPLQSITGRSGEQYTNPNLALADNLVATPYAPDTDDDDIYATTEGDSTILAPIIADPNAVTPGRRDSIERYLVQSGDSISTIAQRFGISTNTLLWENNLSFYSTIRPGQELTILPVSGVTHTVASGDTVGAIAKKYQADADGIVRHNKLADAGDIQIGEKLIIPDGIEPTAVALRPQPRVTLPSAIRDVFVPSSPAPDTGSRLLWPLNSSRITQYFHAGHSGLDVGDTLGNPIYAAEAGKVERAGWTSGYGYNIIVNHGNGIQTLYGHASRLLAGVGDTVARGQTIALIGSTGWSTGPHLHFEVRVNGRRLNPLNYLR